MKDKDKFDIENIDEIVEFLRSVYRYAKIIELNAPPILMNIEEKIFAKRLNKLNHKDLVMAFSMWNDFYEEKTIDDAILDAEIDRDLKNMRFN